MEFDPEIQEYNLIFLDIDGVLNRNLPAGVPTAADARRLDPNAISNLMFLIQEAEYITNRPVRIILSSSWREAGDLDHIRNMFKSTPFVIYIIGKTPALVPRSRPAEILSWLYDNVDRYRIRNFVVLDDYPPGLDLFGEHYIRIHQDRLLTAENIRSAIEVLSSPGLVTREMLDNYEFDLSRYENYNPDGCIIS